MKIKDLRIIGSIALSLFVLTGTMSLFSGWSAGLAPSHAQVRDKPEPWFAAHTDLGEDLVRGIRLLIGSEDWESEPARGLRRVRTTELQAGGPDGETIYNVAPDCNGVPTPCHTSLQAAVDAVDDRSDEIRVAGGTYSDVIARPAPYTTSTITQVVYISKSLTLRGGYTTADGLVASDPHAYPTTLDAGGGGRVVFVGQPSEELITVTLENLTIANGDATGLGGPQGQGQDTGGGVCVISATASLRDNDIHSNTGDFGGGIALHGSDAATLSANIIHNNTGMQGGGVFLSESSNAVLDNNVIIDNKIGEYSGGSGVFLEFESTADIRHNTIARNTGGDGSGVSLILNSSAALTNNVLVSHTVGLAVGSYNSPCTATLESTLLATGTVWANVTPTVTGDAGVIAATNNVTGTPDFADPDNGDYHIGRNSSALNAGVEAGVTTDIDGDARDARPDLGADEYPLIWAHDGGEDEWEFGTPSNTDEGAPTHCASGPEGCWVTDLDDYYNNDADQNLYSPPIIVPTSASLPLSASWQQAWYIEDADYDHARAHYRCNGGAWVMLWEHANHDEDGAENWQTAPGAPFPLTCGLSDTVEVRFQLTSDGSETHPGYYVDDLRVYDAAGRTLYSIGPPQMGKTANQSDIQPGDTVTYSLQVTNTRATSPTFTISDTLDSHQKPLTVTASRGTCAIADSGWGGGVTCTIPSLAVDERVAVTMTAQTSDTLSVFEISNSAVVSDGLQTGEAQATVEVDACYVRLVEGGSQTDYDTIQAAVDAASGSDSEVQVAGVCGDLFIREGETQIAYISKTLTLRGGYDPDFTTHDPDQYPTVLDAQDQGRAIYIADPGAVTVTHLTLTGGNDGSGGAVYAHLDEDQQITFQSNVIQDNTSSGSGGGIYVRGNIGEADYGHVILDANVIQNNTSSGGGGGVVIGDTDQVTVTGNTFRANSAGGDGGAFRIWESSPLVFNDNQVLSNTAQAGGGLNLHARVYQAALTSNTIAYNIAHNGNGGGLLKTDGGEAILEHNTAFSNTASGAGGGLYVNDGTPIFRFNDICRNQSGGSGGGVYMGDSACGGDNLMRGNVLRGNLAGGHGGGIFLDQCASMNSFANNVVIDNRLTAGYGSGLCISGGIDWSLLHTTIGNNVGQDDIGVYARNGANATLENTLVYSQGIGVVAAGSNVNLSLDHTFWDATSVVKETQEDGGGTVSETNNRQGDAGLSDDGYHLTGDSEAIDRGVSSVSDDVDGEPRADGSPDIGADEYAAAVDPGLDKTRQGSGDVEAGQPVTYTLIVSNSAASHDQVTVLLTDTLTPQNGVAGVAFQTVGGDQCSANGGGFTCTVYNVAKGDQRTVTAIVTTAGAFEGVLTNTARLAALAGAELDPSDNAAGPVTVTVAAAAPDQPDLWVTKRASAQYLRSGDALTYTLQWGNQGSAAATGTTLTDTLPADVTFGSAQGSPSRNSHVLTWDLGSVEADDSGAFQVTVNAGNGLDDGTQLVNHVAIGSASAESATANNADQVTSTVYATGGISLTVEKDALGVTNDEVELEDAVQYRVVISNSGPVSTPFTLEDAIPEGTEYVSHLSEPSGATYIADDDKIYWDHGDVLTTGMSVTVTINVKVVACGGAECAVIRNVAQVRVPDVSYVWQAQRDLWVKCPDLAVSLQERGQSGRPTYFHYDGLPHENGYLWSLAYENVDKGDHASLAASPRITLTLTGNAHFATGNTHIDPDPAQADAGRIVWTLDELAPGASDTIDYFTVILDGYDDDGYTLDAEIGPAEGQECESDRDNNTDDETIPAIAMDFQKRALEPRVRWQHDSQGNPTNARFEIGYQMLLRYRNSYPARPMAYNLEIEDPWPSDLPLDWQDGHLDGVGAWDFREESDKVYWSGDSVLEGARGWLKASGYLSQTTTPHTEFLNTAWLSFEPGDDRDGVYEEKAVAEVEVPLLQPVILRPEDGLQMCPGETFNVTGIAQQGATVDVYLNGTLKQTVSPDNLGTFDATLTAVSGANEIEVSASHGEEETDRGSVTVHAPDNLLWTAYGSSVMGTVTAGPQKGQTLTFDIDDPSDFRIPGVYGFNDMWWTFRTCGCPDSSHKMSVTVSADNGQYTGEDGAPGDRLGYASPFVPHAHRVDISATCYDPTSGVVSDTQDAQGEVLIDPDGYVFNVDKGGRYDPTMGGSFNPVEPIIGVTVTCYVSEPTWGGWIPWPAHVYDQTNPQVTDDNYPDGITTTGYYAFYTPPGHYYIQVEGVEGYQPWRSPVVEVVDEVVHVNVPYTPLPESAAVSVSLTAGGISSPVVTIPVGSAVAWTSDLQVGDTITDLVSWGENPILRPRSTNEPSVTAGEVVQMSGQSTVLKSLQSAAQSDSLPGINGFDGGYLEPGRTYQRLFDAPGTYDYTDAAGNAGQIIVTSGDDGEESEDLSHPVGGYTRSLGLLPWVWVLPLSMVAVSVAVWAILSRWLGRQDRCADHSGVTD